MKKLARFFGVIALGIIFCVGCGNGQADVVSSEHSGEPAEISEKSDEKSTSEQSDGKNTGYGNTNVTSEEPQASTEANTNQPNGATAGEGEQASLSMQERYRDILLNNGEFICTDLQNKELSIDKIKEAVTDDESIAVAVSKFAVVDLSGDGENEAVLWIQINGASDYGFEILRYQENAVYGYTLPYRAFMNLKTDGTFIFTGGVADSGIGRLRFLEGGYTVDMLYYSASEYDSNNELKVQFLANGEACSEEEFNAAMSRQEEKQNVGWYNLTAADVHSAFEHGF